MEKVMIDRKLKRKVESAKKYKDSVCSVRFKDLKDTFWFDTVEHLQEFLNEQSSERYYDKELRKGYFDYVNDANEVLRYHVKSNRGTLEVIREENLGWIQSKEGNG